MKKIAFLLFLITQIPLALAEQINVKLEGVDQDMQRNILSYLSLYQQRNDKLLTPGRIAWLYGKAPDEIRAALEPLGYYHAAIDPDLEHKTDQYNATFRVTPGPPVLVRTRSIEVAGAAEQDHAFSAALKNLPLAPGSIARHDLYEGIKKTLIRLATERGYFHYKLLKNELKIDLESDRADIVVRMDSGERYRFGRVSFSQIKLNKNFLSRFIPFHTDDPYDTQKVLEFQRNLRDSDYFDMVNVHADPDKAEDGLVPVTTELTMRKPSKYTLGAGYGTDTGPRVSAGLEKRYLNSYGHSFSADASISELISRIHLRHSIPLDKPQTDRLNTTLEWNDENSVTSDSESLIFAVSREQQLTEWRRTYGISYRNERYRIGSEYGESQLLMPALGFSRVKTDNPIFTRKGQRLQFDIRGAIQGIASDNSFIQTRLGWKRILPIGPGRLLLRGDLGVSWVREFNELPPSVRFFTGGDFSVRGYEYNSLGPKDSNGNVIGGRHLIVGSVEYDHPIIEKWRGAIFYDIGNAINHLSDPLFDSAGIGIRWKSPVGLFRLDVARPLAGDDRSLRLHITFGPDL